MRIVATAFLALAALLSGCNASQDSPASIAPQETQRVRDAVDELARQDFPAIEARLAPRLRTADLRQSLGRMAALIPPGPPQSAEAVGVQVLKTDSATFHHLTLEYEYPQSWLVVSAMLEQRDGAVVFNALQVTPASQSLAATHRFSLEGKTPGHYLFLALAIGIPLGIVYTLWVCVRTPIPKRKWLWCAGVAVGVVQCHLDWTTGAWSAQWLSLQLLGAGFAKAGPQAPLILTISAPVGALAFWVRRRSFVRAASAAPQAAPDAR
ncbi:hypothetical protein AVME950_12435 [Acidovorax sp. SUPP950]|uniref:hypothetical protein n=1 Tax=Acidovorax sp. SUPP950 TaxID=511901 RepID=UPI0023BE0681|nr:hypothetical protein [Acidovorax sp. SUPP950]GKS75705.1 hypothetical protein AVME950_12435 [Acidovorax sp. SUPP950]